MAVPRPQSSVGAIASGVLLVRRLIHAIRPTAASHAAYRRLVAELHKLETALGNVSRLQLDSNQGRQKLALKRMTRQCITKIQRFISKNTQLSQSPGQRASTLQPARRTNLDGINWALCEEEAVDDLRIEVTAYTTALYIILATAHMSAAELREQNLRSAADLVQTVFDEMSRVRNRVERNHFVLSTNMGLTESTARAISGLVSGQLDAGLPLNAFRSLRWNIRILFGIRQIQQVLAGIPRQIQAHTPPQTQAHTPSQTQVQTPPHTQAQTPPHTQAQTPPHTQAQTPPHTQAQTPPHTQAQTPPQVQAQTPPQVQAHTPPQIQAHTPPQIQAHPPPQSPPQMEPLMEPQMEPQVETESEPQVERQEPVVSEDAQREPTRFDPGFLNAYPQYRSVLEGWLEDTPELGKGTTQEHAMQDSESNRVLDPNTGESSMQAGSDIVDSMVFQMRRTVTSSCPVCLRVTSYRPTNDGSGVQCDNPDCGKTFRNITPEVHPSSGKRKRVKGWDGPDDIDRYGTRELQHVQKGERDESSDPWTVGTKPKLAAMPQRPICTPIRRHQQGESSSSSAPTTPTQDQAQALPSVNMMHADSCLAGSSQSPANNTQGNVHQQGSSLSPQGSMRPASPFIFQGYVPTPTSMPSPKLVPVDGPINDDDGFSPLE